MSEAKRVPLQTLEFPESLGHAAKKEKKGDKGKQLAPSFRFTLALPESNEKTCPEFNYAQLLKAAEKKRRKEQKRGEENSTNGLGPFDDDDDEAKLRDMARRFEAKYGTSTMGKKRHKYDDYVDLGAGYDENDSFIDNTDAYDEIVPEEMTTAHGGFYINCGALEFKAADRHTLLHNNNNNNNNNNNSDEDESSESTEEDTEDVDSPKRTEKRIVSSSDEDETEDITGDHPRKKQKIDEGEDKKSNQENAVKKKKKQQEQHNSQDGDILNRRKEKREAADAEGGAASEDQEDKKKFDKVDGQKSKSDSEKKFDIKKFEKKASSSNGFDGKKLDLKKLGGKDCNIDDAIESVVNAARVDDESSRDTTDSGKSRCLGTESECDDMDKEEPPLPDSVNCFVKPVEFINQLKAHAENIKEGKSKFFNPTVNELLFKLEKYLRSGCTIGDRCQTYRHLAWFLPCSKITLQNRAKKLYLQDIEHRVKEPMQRLKAIIDDVMPSVMDKYVKDCQKVADENPQLYWEIYRYCWGFEGSPADADSTDDEDGSKSSEKSKIPRRRFPWTRETKKLILEIANARREYFEVLRPRKETMASFVEKFLETKVLPLWPPGYVQLQTLIKYSDPSIDFVLARGRKRPKGVSGNNVAPSGNTVCNSTARNDTTAANSVSSQERDTPATAVSKVPNITENSANFANQGAAKSNDVSMEKKQQNTKLVKDKTCQRSENPTAGNANPSMGKISVVPTAQLMAQKPVKAHVEKFNLMDLGNSSLSITPVNDFHKSAGKINETKKDVVSITAYPETSNILPNTNEVPQTGHHSVHREEASYSSNAQPQHSSYPTSSQTSLHSKTGSLKHRLLHENTEVKSDKRLEEKDIDITNKTDKRDKRRERCMEVKHKSHDVKKRKKDQKLIDSQVGPMNPEVVPMQQQASPSKEEQEQKQNEETIAATNFLSQIINDDTSVRGLAEKRKESSLGIEETVGSLSQPTEQEKDVQMVMRSLKELQELQEMKYSPSHSPIGSSLQKSNKSSAQYVTYQEDYQRLYLKKDDKLRPKEEAQW